MWCWGVVVWCGRLGAGCGWVGVVEGYCCFCVVECFLLESCGEFEFVVEFVDNDQGSKTLACFWAGPRYREARVARAETLRTGVRAVRAPPVGTATVLWGPDREGSGRSISI